MRLEATLELKLNTLVIPSCAASKCTKTYFLFIFALFSLNFGFVTFKSLKLNLIVTLWCLFQVFTIAFIIIHYFVSTLDDRLLIGWYIKYVGEYCILVVGSYFGRTKSFATFWSNLIFIDTRLGIVNGMRTIEIIMISMLFYCFCFRFLCSYIYCTFFTEYCIQSKITISAYQIPILSTDIFLIVYFVIFFSVYLRVKFFVRLVRNACKEVILYHHIYKNIIDVTENGKSVYDVLYLVPLIGHTFDLFLTVFFPLSIREKNFTDILSMMAANVSLIHVMLLLFLPAFAAGLLSRQVESLKLVLHERLLQERDQKHTKDIERFIKYIEARPFRFAILGIVSLDWKLPLIVLNICVTYLIVVLQFTHKY